MASMPHLSQLARDYRDKGVTVIGLTSADARNTLDAVRSMVEDKGDGMDYSVAWDVERTTNEAWMTAAGQRGIPTAFLVDQAGKLAWIGHPMEADIPLAEVVAGTWDPVDGPARMKAYSEKRRAIHRAVDPEPQQALTLLEELEAENPLAAKGLDPVRFAILVRLSAQPERAAQADALGARLVDEAVAARDSGSLNSLAWGLVDPEATLEDRRLDLALRAAEQADALTGSSDPSILDTLARVHFWRGDLDRALALQRKAIEHASERGRASLQGALEEYEAALAETDQD